MRKGTAIQITWHATVPFHNIKNRNSESCSYFSQYTKPNIFLYRMTSYTEFAMMCSSGPGGNRTRVQKPIPCTSTIIVSSLSFPLPYGKLTSLRFSSFMIRLPAQSFAGIVSHIVGARFLKCECLRADMQQLGCS